MNKTRRRKAKARRKWGRWPERPYPRIRLSNEFYDMLSSASLTLTVPEDVREKVWAIFGELVMKATKRYYEATNASLAPFVGRKNDEATRHGISKTLSGLLALPAFGNLKKEGG